MTNSAPDFTAALGDPTQRELGDLARLLSTDLERGLSAEDAARRLAELGPNELRAKPRVPAWMRFAAQFRDPLIYLLLAAVAISVLAWGLEGHGWPVDAALWQAFP